MLLGQNLKNVLGIILDFKLKFEEHLKWVITKANKNIASLLKLKNILPRKTIIYAKIFFRSYRDYSDFNLIKHFFTKN